MTFNVGTVEGGTSVNTIAQNAKMLCEYRSDDLECLTYMQQKFTEIFEAAAQREGVTVNVKRVGERPCGCVEEEKLEAYKALVAAPVEGVIGKKVVFRPSSTDCNIPQSLGIPALNVGVKNGFGAPTREEKIEKASVIPGLEIAIRLFAALTEVEV